jgi:hypothetical protein
MKKYMTRPLAFFMLCCMLFILPVGAQAVEADIQAAVLPHEIASILSINSLEDANAFLDHYSIGILLITALIALLMAFWGYRSLHFAVLLGGFFAGWTIGTALYAWIHKAGLLTKLEPIPSFVPYLLSTLLGVLTAFIAMRIIRAGIFLASTASAYFFLNSFPSLNQTIDQLITEDIDAKYMIVRLIIALLVGALALLFTRVVLIIVTGAAGGMIASIAIMVAIEQTANINLELALGLILAIIGMIVQFTTGRRKKRIKEK